MTRNRTQLQLIANEGLDDSAVAYWRRVHPGRATTCGKALQTRARVVVPDFETCDFIAGSDDLVAFRAAGVRAAQSTPLLTRNGRLVGMITTHWTRAHAPQARELRLLGIVAETVGDEVAIRVVDTGIGIPAAMLPKIFDLFTQVDGSNERAQGGLGGGLALAKQLAEMHAGRIEVESPGPDGGSVFTVRLPLAAAAAGPAQDGPACAAPARGAALRVMVVDDHADAAETLALLLEEMGHATQVMLESPRAVAAALAFRLDVVLLDIGMPHLDGFALARLLRAEAGLDGVHLAALSGWGTDEDRAKSREAGIDRHLTKPVVMREVAQMLAGVAPRV